MITKAIDALAEVLCDESGFHWLPEPPDEVCLEFRKRATDVLFAMSAAGWDFVPSDVVTNAVRVAKQATGLSEFEQARYERTGEIVVNLPFDPCPTCGSDGVHAESCPAFADQPEAMKQATGED